MKAIANNPTSYRVPVVAGVIFTLVVGLSGAKSAEIEPRKTTQEPLLDTKSLPQVERKAVWMQHGIASWYGIPFHGRRTANGEVYDMNELTCAHPTLPMGTLLKVINLENSRSIFVRVNDRGPIAPHRIIDLSLAAAQALGFTERGTVSVRIERFKEITLQDAAEVSAPTVAQLATPRLLTQ
jgi:rare lipoprotein A